MEYRKYRAPTLREARLKLLLDLGNKAYIVDQKPVRVGGVFGIGGKPMVEITAAVMPEKEESHAVNLETQKEKRDTKVNNSISKQHKPAKRSSADVEGASPDAQELIKMLEENRKLKEFLQQNRSTKKKAEQPEVEVDLQTDEPLDDSEDDEYKPSTTQKTHAKNRKPMKLGATYDEPDEPDEWDENASPEPVQRSNRQAVKHGSKQTEESPEENRRKFLKMILKNQDFDDTFIEKFIAQIEINDAIFSPNNLQYLRDLLVSNLDQFIHTENGAALRENEPNVIALVGPTGVGKTTTLAKLGAFLGIFQKKRVKFISIDNYRVGAIQQLKLYADIMEIPFYKVNNVDELRNHLIDDDFDICLIDTAGRSQKNTDDLKEIREYLKIIPYHTIVSLVVSATTKYRDLLDILERYDILEYQNLIISKMDETNSIGQLISALDKKQTTLSYLSFGQNVPDDISGASHMQLVDQMVK